MADRDFEAARVKLEQAQAIVRKTRGETHRDMLSTLRYLSLVAKEQAKPDAARTYAEDGLRMAQTLDVEVDEFKDLIEGLDGLDG